MLAAGITEDQLGNWCSDLYVLKTPESTKVLEAYEFKSNVTTFVSQAEPYKGKIWYEIPFAYVEHNNILKGYQLITIREFYTYNPSFLGNRERSTIFSPNAYIVEDHGYPGCIKVHNPDHDGDNTCVISWDHKGIKRGTIRN
jgi:hypothetical protein